MLKVVKNVLGPEYWNKRTENFPWTHFKNRVSFNKKPHMTDYVNGNDRRTQTTVKYTLGGRNEICDAIKRRTTPRIYN